MGFCDWGESSLSVNFSALFRIGGAIDSVFLPNPKSYSIFKVNSEFSISMEEFFCFGGATNKLLGSYLSSPRLSLNSLGYYFLENENFWGYSGRLKPPNPALLDYDFLPISSFDYLFLKGGFIILEEGLIDKAGSSSMISLFFLSGIAVYGLLNLKLDVGFV